MFLSGIFKFNAQLLFDLGQTWIFLYPMRFKCLNKKTLACGHILTFSSFMSPESFYSDLLYTAAYT